MQEVWKNIPEYIGYQVSDLWRIKSLNYRRSWKEKIMTPYKSRNWYMYIYLFKDWKRKDLFVHRLILNAFRWCEKDLFCNHINWIRDDNRLKNLEWCTRSENVKHSYNKLSRKPNLYWKWKTWKDHPKSKLYIKK